MDVVYSVNDVPIRLTDERWEHIVSNKPYMESYYDTVPETIEQPTWVLRGHAGALVAVLALANSEYLNVVYREVTPDDGFIITAFISRKVNEETAIWPRKY